MQARYSLGLESEVEHSVYCLFVCTSVHGLPVGHEAVPKIGNNKNKTEKTSYES